MQDTRKRMQSLIEKLDEASRAYYKEDREIMSNLEYDALYDELVELEKKTGFILSNSPTQTVGYKVAEFLRVHFFYSSTKFIYFPLFSRY